MYMKKAKTNIQKQHDIDIKIILSSSFIQELYYKLKIKQTGN